MVSSEGETEKFVVLHCAKDDSHVLVPLNDCLFDNKLNVGDSVNFDFPGQKDLLIGTVKGISTDQKHLKQLMNSLNASTKPKREASFHADRPRKAAQRAKEIGFKTLATNGNRSAPRSTGGSVSKAPPVPGEKEAPSASMTLSTRSALKNQQSGSLPESRKVEPKQSVSDRLLSDSELALPEKHSDSEGPSDKLDTSDGNSSSDDKNGLTEEEKNMLEKLNRKQEMLQLKALAKKRPHDDQKQVRPPEKSKKSDRSHKEPKTLGGDERQGEKDLKSEARVSEKKRRNKPEGEDNDNQDFESCDSDVSQKKSPQKQENAGLKKKRKRKGKDSDDQVVKITFEGEQFNYLQPEDNKVVPLNEGTNVYISKRDRRKAKSDFSSATALARFLTRAVFTKEARNVCSVSGKKSFVRGQKMAEQRTALDQSGIDAITDFVMVRASRSNWKGGSEATLKQAIANMLCEERPTPTVSVNQQTN